MNSLNLYITYRSPYARKVRVALLEKQIPFNEIIIDLANRPETFFKLNPAGTVPTLETPDGLILDDSTLILQYLEEAYPQKSLVPSSLKEKYLAWNWEELADRLCDQNILVFFENQKENKRPEVFEKCERVTKAILEKLQTALKSQDYILGSYSVADISMACVMNWMSFRLQTDWGKWGSEVANWLKRINERESFQKTLPRM